MAKKSPQSSTTRSNNRQRWLGVALITASVIVAVIALGQALDPAPTGPAQMAIPIVAAEASPSPGPMPESVTREPLIPTSVLASPTPLLPATPAYATRAATVTSASPARPETQLSNVSRPTVSTVATTVTHVAVGPLTRSTVPTMPATASMTQGLLPTHTVIPVSSATAASPAQAGDLPRSTRQRICVSVPYDEAGPNGLAQLKPGWYLNWTVQSAPYRPAGAEFAQMVRVSNDGPRLPLSRLASIAQHNPGALWLIGNEMDVKWQDNVTPERYAAIYHDVYAAIKQADPASQIAIGGVSQPTPLRLQYLDRILAAYRQSYRADLPVDVWNVHNFVLQEKRGDWGADIPPGMEANSGQLHRIADHGSLDIFKQQLYAFRQWMAQHGYRDKQLIVTEYGILMPPDYGFDYEKVRDFMIGTFDFMRTEASSTLGLPADGNHLVQRWCWYSLSDNIYPTGNLVDFKTQELTPLGRDFQAYLTTH